MSDDIVSKKTRTEFREFLVGWTLREISDEFEAAGIECDRDFNSQLSGSRRSLVERYYHSLDFTDPSDVRKLLGAYETILTRALEAAINRDPSAVESLVSWLRRDGFTYENGQIAALTPAARAVLVGASEGLEAARSAAAVLGGDYVQQQIARMETAVGRDPELAIGTAKEFAETICKAILEEHGVPYERDEDLPRLLRVTLKQLQLSPDDVDPGASAADTIRRLLQNLATIAQNLAELRNLHGTGHGKSPWSRGLRTRHARLAIGAATTLGVFLVETHRDAQDQGTSGTEA